MKNPAIVRLSAEQIETMIVLKQRENQLKRMQIRGLGVTDEEMDTPTDEERERNRHRTTPEVALGGQKYGLLSEDNAGATFQRIDN